MIDLERIRGDVPILDRIVNGYKLVYFDNAATTQKPIQVIDAIVNYYKFHNSNVHRGVHTLSQEATELYESAHEEAAKFIGAEGLEEIVFVKNTTEAINLVAYSLGMWSLEPEDEVVITAMDHHSNIVPWHMMSELKGFKLRIVRVKEDGTLDLEDLADKVSSKTRIVAVPHVSNVLGVVNDVKSIAKIAHEVDALILVDGAQSVPHMPIDVKDLDIDFLAFSGHKMLGPTGIGVLYGRRDILESMRPFLGGGDMISEVHSDVETGRCTISYNIPPWRFEAGTPNIAGAVGLAEAIRYLRNIGMENVLMHERDLVEYTLRRMEELGKTHVYGPKDPGKRLGVVSFNVEGLDSHETAMMLDSYGIMVRSGLHCAQPLHETLSIQTTTRASFYIYNTREEVDRFIEALMEIEMVA